MEKLNKHSLVSLGNRIRFDGWKHGDNVNDIYEKLKKPQENQVNERSEKVREVLSLDMYENPSEIYINKKLTGEHKGIQPMSTIEVLKTINNGDIKGNVLVPTKEGFAKLSKILLDKAIGQNKVNLENDDISIDLSFKKGVDASTLYVRRVFSIVTSEKCKFEITNDRHWWNGIEIMSDKDLSGTALGPIEVLNKYITIKPENNDNSYFYKITCDYWDQKNQTKKNNVTYLKSLQKNGERWGSTLIDMKGSDFNDKSFNVYIVTSTSYSQGLQFDIDENIQFEYVLKWGIKIEDIITDEELKRKFDEHLRIYYLNDLSYFASLNMAKCVLSKKLLAFAPTLKKLYGTSDFDKIEESKEYKKDFVSRMTRIKWILKKHKDLIILLKQADSLLKNISLDSLRDFLVKVGQYNNNSYKLVREDKKSKKHVIKPLPVLHDWGFKWDSSLEMLDISLLKVNFTKSELMIEQLVKWCNSIVNRLAYRPAESFTFENWDINNALKHVESVEIVKRINEKLGYASFAINSFIKSNLADKDLSDNVEKIIQLPDIIAKFIHDTIMVFSTLVGINDGEKYFNTISEKTLETIKSYIAAGMEHREIDAKIFYETIVSRIDDPQWIYVDRKTKTKYKKNQVIPKNDFDYESRETQQLKLTYENIQKTLTKSGESAKLLGDIYTKIYADHLLPALFNVNDLASDINVMLPSQISKFLTKAILIDKDDFNTINSKIINLVSPIRLENIEQKSTLVIGDFWKMLKSGFFEKLIGSAADSGYLKNIASKDIGILEQNIIDFIVYVDKYLAINESSSLLSNVVSINEKTALLKKYELIAQTRIDEISKSNKLVNNVGFVTDYSVSNITQKFNNAINRGKDVAREQKKTRMKEIVAKKLRHIETLKNTHPSVMSNELRRAIEELEDLKNVDNVYLDIDDIKEIEEMYKDLIELINRKQVEYANTNYLALVENNSRLNTSVINQNRSSNKMQNFQQDLSKIFNTNPSYNKRNNFDFTKKNQNYNDQNYNDQNYNDQNNKHVSFVSPFDNSRLKKLPDNIYEMPLTTNVDPMGNERVGNIGTNTNVIPNTEINNFNQGFNPNYEQGNIQNEMNNENDAYDPNDMVEMEEMYDPTYIDNSKFTVGYTLVTGLNDFDKTFVKDGTHKFRDYDVEEADKQFMDFLPNEYQDNVFVEEIDFNKHIDVPINEYSVMYDSVDESTYARAGKTFKYVNGQVVYTPYGKFVIMNTREVKYPPGIYGVPNVKFYLNAINNDFIDFEKVFTKSFVEVTSLVENNKIKQKILLKNLFLHENEQSENNLDKSINDIITNSQIFRNVARNEKRIRKFKHIKKPNLNQNQKSAIRQIV